MVNVRKERTQAIVDAFADKHSPCCAGCDWWRWHNSVVGECIRNAPVSGAERVAMLGIAWISCTVPAGHIMTPRDHWCGEFDERRAKRRPHGVPLERRVRSDGAITKGQK